MSGWFSEHLSDLVPSLYLQGKESEDLKTFLKLPLGELDRFKELTDSFPDLFDVEKANPLTLALLAQSVGVEFNGQSPPETERRKIKEAVPRYRRKGTLPALERDLRALGWEGYIDESFQETLRLNLRALLNKSRLTGQLSGHGVYRIHSFNVVPGLREIQKFHHPAGTRAFWDQWLIEELSLADITGDSAMHLRYLIYAALDDVFMLNKSRLNDCSHLTRKQRTWGLFQLTSVAEVDHTIEQATACLSRWHGRQNRMRLGVRPLNQWRLADCWESETKFIECHRIYGGTVDDNYRDPLILGEGKLNQNQLSLGISEKFTRFKKKDFLGISDFGEMVPTENGLGLGLTSAGVLSPWFTLSGVKLNGVLPLAPLQKGDSVLFPSLLSLAVFTEPGSITKIDRYSGRSTESLRLGFTALNNAPIASASVNSDRLSFEVETDLIERLPSLQLGKTQLNTHALSWAEPSIRWLIPQT